MCEHGGENWVGWKNDSTSADMRLYQEPRVTQGPWSRLPGANTRWPTWVAFLQLNEAAQLPWERNPLLSSPKQPRQSPS